MTIEQTIEIPADHRLVLEMPHEIPAGTKVDVVIKSESSVNSFSSLRTSTEPADLDVEPSVRGSPLDTRSNWERHFDEALGCVKGTGILEGDSVEIIRKMRDEW
jgi:hypothetical protein